MAAGRCHRLTLTDVLVLIAAAAVGLAADCYLWSDAALGFEVRSWRTSTLPDLRSLVGCGIVLSTPPAVMWSAATVALHLRRPRERTRRAVRRPGMAACCASSSASVIGIGVAGCAALGRNDISARLLLSYGLPLMAGSAVAAVWLVLVLSRSWNSSSLWPDRLGRLLGGYWLASITAIAFAVAGR
jgi:hypothetical protein